MNSVSTSSTSTAGIIIIGDEILKGLVADTNTNFITRKLYSLGVKVQKIAVIPDDVDLIAKEVRDFSTKYKHVITTGGIGPTHDDLTFEGVAKAFNEQLFYHPKLVEAVRLVFGDSEEDTAQMKMAHVPFSSKLHYGPNNESRYPVVSVRNVFILPGVPNILKRIFKYIEPLLKTNNALILEHVYIKNDEVSITPVLNKIEEKFRQKVLIGSYPDFNNSYYKVKLTLESVNQKDIDAVIDLLKSSLSEDVVIDYDEFPIENAAEKVNVLSREDSPLGKRVKSAMEVVAECYQRFTPNQVFLGFNGGKDCTVVLHLVHAYLNRRLPANGEALKILYIRRDAPFVEMESFIESTKNKYKLNVNTAVSNNIKDALQEFTQENSSNAAVIMGTRRTDPHCENLHDFQQTDPGWPQLMRVNPILNWTYSDVWEFIRRLNLPYCTLYDKGYTSLGSSNNTIPNPFLKMGNIYLPAYKLESGENERAGRNSSILGNNTNISP
ncbi:DgyrCDS7716 [Dimorphilus gyrociliatus]|uniref:FAD synthase n=1 Tax=Dimorphilus gyrociliatus TaxID=2664684 RepID=A0A7I8VRY0_9ANNE|nr:DgyrCDS7716 [Dimorphilus gyrociliatus]